MNILYCRSVDICESFIFPYYLFITLGKNHWDKNLFLHCKFVRIETSEKNQHYTNFWTLFSNLKPVEIQRWLLILDVKTK